MAKQRDLAIFFILDGSGSMSHVQKDVVGGLNDFIKAQKKEKNKVKFWLTVFDTNVEKLYEGVNIKDVAAVTQSDTLLGGMTALLDAVGKTVSEAQNDKSLKKLEKLVIIYTDGAENSSKEYTKEKITSLIKDLEDSGSWTFTFMGADIDAFAAAGQYGLATANVAAAASVNTKDNFKQLRSATHAHSHSGLSGAQATFYTSDDKEPEPVHS